MTSVFEVERDGPSLTIWEASIGHRVIFGSETLAVLQEQRLQSDEKRFHKAKLETGLYAIEAYGELVGPVDYIRQNFKAWRSSAAEPLGIIVIENCVSREPKEYW